jgi:hypothetical protein
MPRENPFYHRRAIRSREHFFGRKQELTMTFNRLRNMESISLIGERRVGKTSFLFHLADPTVASEHGLKPERYLLQYVNFQAHTASTLSDFWHFVLDDMMGRGLTAEPAIDKLRNQEEVAPIDIAQLLREFQKEGVTLVFLFDEFDSATQNPNFDLAFFNGLRSLADSYQYNVAYVTATPKSLQDIYYEKEALGSPFFNYFTQVILSFFTEEEAIEAIQVPAEGLFRKSDIDFALRHGGCHPFIQQLVCLYLFEAYQTGKTGTEKEKYDYVIDKLRGDIADHFRYWWEHSNDGEKITLSLLALLERWWEAKGEFGVEEVFDKRDLRNLERRALARRVKDRFRVFSSLFAAWIIDEIRYTVDVKPVSFDEWLERADVKSLTEKVREATSDVKSALQKIKPEYWMALAKWLATKENIEQAKDFIAGLLQSLK